MSTTISPMSKLKIAAESEGPSTSERSPLSTDSLKAGFEWGLGRAWRLHMLWGPLAKAAEAVVAGSRPAMEGQLTFRVLVIAPQSAALSGMLENAGAGARSFRFQLRVPEPDGEPSLPFEAGAFDCAIALDWLPLIRSSERQRAVAELCRIARLGVLIANPFHTPEVAASERAVNALYLAATDEDHPHLGRHLEYGLPELDRTRAWVGKAFAHVLTEPIETLATWQAFAGVAIHDRDGEITAEEAALAALLPPLDRAVQLPAYRTLVVGSSSALVSLAAARAQSGDSAVLATHMAIEAAAQRRALDRLTEAITTESAREREDFRATVASLAAELHEREAYAGLLVADLNRRDCVLADQTAVIEALERRLSDADVHVRNLETEKEATNAHVRNLEAEKEATNAHVRNLETEREATNAHVRNLETEREATNAHVRNLETEREATNANMRNLATEREATNARLRNLETEREAINARVRGLLTEREATKTDIRNLENERHATNVHVEGSVALLSAQLIDTQTQLQRITGSWGWRLLSSYGRFKYRYLLPIYRLFGQVSAERTETEPGQNEPV